MAFARCFHLSRFTSSNPMLGALLALLATFAPLVSARADGTGRPSRVRSRHFQPRLNPIVPRPVQRPSLEGLRQGEAPARTTARTHEASVGNTSIREKSILENRHPETLDVETPAREKPDPKAPSAGIRAFRPAGTAGGNVAKLAPAKASQAPAMPAFDSTPEAMVALPGPLTASPFSPPASPSPSKRPRPSEGLGGLERLSLLPANSAWHAGSYSLSGNSALPQRHRAQTSAAFALPSPARFQTNARPNQVPLDLTPSDAPEEALPSARIFKTPR